MNRFIRSIGVAATAITFALQTHAEPLPESFSGDAYAIAGGDLLYHETHFQFADDTGTEQLVLYRCPNGQPFARKRSHDDGNAQTPDFDLVDARLGYREGVRRRGDQREVYVQRTAAQPEQADLLRVPPDGVIDSGFDAFAQKHWHELQRGDTVRFNFLVPSRRTFFAFKVSRIANPTAPSGALTFRLSSGSWFSFLLPHIDITYDTATRHLVRYEGLSNIRGANGKNLQVRYEYPKIAVNHDVAPADIAAAIATPLASSCTLADNQASASGHATLP
jgi:hypothetical protein